MSIKKSVLFKEISTRIEADLFCTPILLNKNISTLNKITYIYGKILSQTVFQKDIGSCMECDSEGKESKNHVPQERMKGVKHIITETSLEKEVENVSNNREC